jgi:hypothetical protein
MCEVREEAGGVEGINWRNYHIEVVQRNRNKKEGEGGGAPVQHYSQVLGAEWDPRMYLEG